MRTMSRLIAGAASAAMLLLAGVPGVASADTARPFKGTVVGEMTFPVVGTDVCPGGMRSDTAAAGPMSHLGWTSAASKHCTPAGPTVTGGTTTLTAANGDKVYLTYDATQLDMPDVFGGTVELGGIIPVVGDFHVVGGTGRFDGASGGGAIEAGVVYAGLGEPTWPGTWTYTGTITY